MSKNLIERCGLALQVYAQAIAIVAERSGAEYTAPRIHDEERIRLAGRLAMPGTTAPANQGPPALQSLAGHLHGASQHGYYAPQVLDATQASAIMPLLPRPDGLTDSYRKLWQAMQRQLVELPGDAAPDLREAGYLGLLQRYTWAMAAPGGGDTDISLFDYTRVQAALAVCLAEHSTEQSEVALLIGGDVSGVQDWLYTIGSEGAAKSLRGRSVYLQLLSEIIAQWLLDSLELPSCNLLYAGGGNFYILAPLNAAARLDVLQVELTQRLLKMHDGALYVALGHTKLTRAELEQQEIGKAWGRVNAEMSLRKRRRFAELTDNEMAQAIGSPLAGTGKPKDSCRVCRRPICQDEKPAPNEDEERACQLCDSFEDLGNRLPNADFLVVSRLPKTTAAEAVLDWRAGLGQFGYDVQFVWQDRQGRGAWRAPASDLVRIYFWKPEQSTLNAFPGVPDPATSVWLYRPLAQAVPMRDGRVATFDQLETEGVQRWGVLRMDVDKLGAIFQHGVQPASLGRVVGLSGLLRLFFEGYVPQLADGFNANERRRIYLMYAGGDDLFVVGGWSHLPELAWEIRQALRKFAAGNDKLTISAGISLALSERYPIYQAAADAGEAEAMAKREGRNRIAFLGQAVEWERFIAVRKQTLEMSAWFTSTTYRAPRSILTNLATVYAEWHSYRRRELGQLTKQGQKGLYKNHKEIFLGPWQWHLLYGVNRARERMTDNSLRDGIDALVTSVLHGEIRHLGLEIRWVELLTRTRSEDNK